MMIEIGFESSGTPLDGSIQAINTTEVLITSYPGTPSSCSAKHLQQETSCYMLYCDMSESSRGRGVGIGS